MRAPARVAGLAVGAAAAWIAAAALLGMLGLVRPVPVWTLWPTAVGAVAAAVGGCLVAAGTGNGAGRLFWLQFAVSTALFDVGALLQTIGGLHATGPTVVMSPLSGILYVVAVAVVLVALVRLPGHKRSWRATVALWLDIAVVAVAAGLMLEQAMQVMPEPVADGLLATVLHIIVLAAASGAVAAVVKVGMSGTPAVDGRALWLLAPSGLLGPLSLVTVPLLRPWPHLNGTVVVLLAFAMLVALAARVQTLENLSGPPTIAPVAARPARRPGISFVPYVAVAVATLMLLGSTLHNGYLPGRLAAGTLALVLLVVVRQHAALLDNNGLLHRLVHQSRRDELTGLFNRRGFTDALAAHRGPATVAVCDLDGFSALNDSLGDDTGDAVLRQAAKRVAVAVGGNATVARLQGDEFGILLAGQQPQTGQALLDAFRMPLSVDGHDLLVTITAGVASGTGDTVPDLLRRAELALQSAQRIGGDRAQQHTPALDATAATTAELAAAMRQGLDRNEFRLLYQPIVELPHGAVHAVEALVRWHPDGGAPVSPAAFIPVAEQTGLIIDLGAWILDTACADAATWRSRHGEAAPRLSINVSARQLLDPELPAVVAAALARHQLPADRVSLEITETAVFAGGPALDAVHALRGLGVGVSLDDFGTGHSSLTLLRTCPVTTLKVDKSFIDELNGGPRQEAIATSLRTIADTLGLQAVAEGVETRAQADRLYALGYRYAQGFYFARPQPAEQIDAMITGRAADDLSDHRTSGERRHVALATAQDAGMLQHGPIRADGTIGELGGPLPSVWADLTGDGLGAMFHADGTLAAVAVRDPAGRTGLITRDTFARHMNGSSGFGHALWARRPIEAVTNWQPLIVDAATTLIEACDLLRVHDHEHRYDDVLVTGPGNALRRVSPARMFDELAVLMRVQAITDPLTGLANRQHFLDRLVAACADRTMRCLVAFIDLDKMKHVNDTLGHNAGDRLIISTARRLAAAARPDDLVARLGGDEFALLCRLPRPDVTEQVAYTIGERIRAAVAAPDPALAPQQHSNASVGIAVAGATADANTLMAEADLAMYQAKKAGGNAVHVTTGVGTELHTHSRLLPTAPL